MGFLPFLRDTGKPIYFPKGQLCFSGREAFGGISGANFNPAVSVALGCLRSMGSEGMDWPWRSTGTGAGGASGSSAGGVFLDSALGFPFKGTDIWLVVEYWCYPGFIYFSFTFLDLHKWQF